MPRPGETKAETPQKKSSDNTQTEIEHVYIGVFFDGTNNNMVQTARFHSTNVFNSVTKSVKKSFWYVADKTPWHDEKKLNADLNEEYKKSKIDGGYTKQSKGKKDYSNIAILHDNYLLNCEKNDDKKKYKHFYIEGSGATDTSHLISGNPNGLGFGLGNTGVTALVSKAVKYVTEYVIGLNLNKDIVTIHFYAFGFSRGATCARLFTHLINRDEGCRINRESEFSEFYAKKYFQNGRLNFLPDFTKKVEMLGIYDTVASIGYLMQKDGQVHPYLRKLLHGFADNYKDNWHYKNVNDYGLYLTGKIAGKTAHICHICAMDEFRENFALTTVGKNVPNNAVEILIPGCHSDVGGGYLNEEEEQEILLTKTRLHNVAGDEEILPAENVLTFVDYQYPIGISVKNDDNSMGIKSLAALGWIDPYWTLDEKQQKITKKKQYFNGKKNIIFTLRAVEDKHQVKFKRNTGNSKGVYSNIPLKMMIAFVNKKASIASDKTQFPDLLFRTEITYYDIPKDLSIMGTQMVSLAEKAEPKTRLWIFPDKTDSSISPAYKALRMQHLHFTSSSELFHLNNPFAPNVATIEGTPGNLGNTPNFDLSGRLCRIVYYGDQTSDCTPNNSVNYLYNLSHECVKTTG